LVQAEDGIRDFHVTGVQTCAPPIYPGWAPAFVHIGGLVLERGGMLSHGAILAREYGIPTVVGIAGVTSAIADGATVRVDADHGRVGRASCRDRGLACVARPRHVHAR